MQALSRTLLRLYEAAEHVSMKHYPGEALRVIRSLISFDGGVLGMGVAYVNDTPNLVIDQAYIYQRDQLIVPDYALISANDPVSRCFAGGLKVPLTCDCGNFYREHRLLELESFCRKHDLSHLMLFGDSATSQGSVKWIVLYRGCNRAFGENEKQYLMAIWPHLARALSINRRHYLDTQLGLHCHQAAALINRRGTIEFAHPSFLDMLTLEWPAFTGNRLPEEIMRCARLGMDYVGSHVQVSVRAQEDLLTCAATRIGRLHGLTSAERVVASQFASGLSHKEIAEKLSVSQHTVRSHISHIYSKLDVHDKAALANALSLTALPNKDQKHSDMPEKKSAA